MQSARMKGRIFERILTIYLERGIYEHHIVSLHMIQGMCVLDIPLKEENLLLKAGSFEMFSCSSCFVDYISTYSGTGTRIGGQVRYVK